MKLVHSFHFFENSVKLEHGNIIDMQTEKITQVLTNLCRDREIFYPKIERVLNKKKSLQNYKRFFNNKNINCNICYNTKVIIVVNKANLIKAIKNNRFNDRGVFFSLLKRNLSSVNTINKDTYLEDILNKNNNLSLNIAFKYFSKDIIQVDELFFDLENQMVYFEVNDIKRNYYNIDLPNKKILFTDCNLKIHNILKENNVFADNKQNLVIYDSNRVNCKFILKTYNFENYILVNDDNVNCITYRDIVNKTILIDYQCLTFKYKGNVIASCSDFKDSPESLEIFIERYRYETKFMDREKFLDMSRVILHSLVYDNVIIFDFEVNEMRHMNNIFIKYFINNQLYFISDKFLEYNVQSFFDKLNNFFDINIPCELSSDFLTKFIKSTFIDDYSNLKKEKSILFDYSKEERVLIENTDNTNKNEKLSLPLLFPIKKMESSDIKYINNNTCAICFEKLKLSSTIKTSCNHYFCQSCISLHIKDKNKIACPLCRNELSKKSGFVQLYNKNKSLQGKIGKIFQNLSNNSMIVSMYNDNLLLLSDILQNSCSDYKNITLVNKNLINKSKEFVNNKTVLFLENSIDKHTRYLYKNSELKVLIPIKPLT
jgi:hypothetical protein